MTEGLLASEAATDNPNTVSFALFALGFVQRDADPLAAYELHRQGLKIAEDSGNRQLVSHHAALLFLLSTNVEPADAMDFAHWAIRNYYDSGNFSMMRGTLAILATFFDQLGRYEPAATITGLAVTPFSRTTAPSIDTTITHLREILGDGPYESFARRGETMTIAEMATYALDQIDQARAQLLQDGESP